MVVRIRTSLRDWLWSVVIGAAFLALGAVDLGFIGLQSRLAWTYVTVGSLYVALGLHLRTFGVDLTPGSAMVRGLRRRNISWSQVQAVVHHRRMGAWAVRLILEDGKAVTLRAPTTFAGLGQPQYEREFHRIGQWWLAHRGESWQHLRPEAPAADPTTAEGPSGRH